MPSRNSTSCIGGADEAQELELSDKKSTSIDQRDMRRMGKQQQLERGFGPYAITGFVSIVMATWEATLLASAFGLFNGGSAGVIWMTIVVWFCFIALVASMAEMASMAPTAGGQYHWVSEFAPASWQKSMSYIVGWSCCLGWIAGIPADAEIAAGLIEGMVLLVNPNANLGALWQTTLIIFLFMFLTFAFNLYLAKYLAVAEGTILIIHVVGFFAFLITLWAVTDHVPAERVFTQFQDGGGWGNLGLSVLVGISSPIFFFVGPDAGVHMSEELKDASLVLPRAMMFSVIFNGALGVVMLITFVFCIPNINAVVLLDQPVLQVIYDITQSYAAACVLGSLLLVLVVAATITNIAAASRQCWAFARDRGFPFSSWIMQVDPKKNLPVNALYVCAIVSFVLAAINFGSDVAFNALVAISNASLTFSYIISISCIRLKRWRGESLLNCRWSLGRFGAPVNDISLAFLLLAFVMSFFPIVPLVGDPTWAADMNWACVVFVAAVVLATGYYFVSGHRMYVPPVRLVKQQ